MSDDFARLKDWIGRTETMTDVATAWPVAALNATFDRRDPAPTPGEAIPPGWHWLYCLETTPASELGNDGHTQRGGFLPPVYQIPTPVLAAMTSRIKVLSRMDVVERRRPQDGRLKTVTPDGDEVELRLSTMPTAFGEKLVMRIFNPENLVKDYAELGFSEEDEQKWAAMTAHPHGIILVTGPTGSGKTTTLYSTLKQLATPEVNVCTVEDPIEMVEPMFNQMQIQQGIGIDFASGIRTLMRQDPDIIMVGEIRGRAYREGMKPLRISGAMKIAAGQTTIEEIMTAAPPPVHTRRATR